ncbi:MAG TPA: GDSL-type esterase/lipase family protein [Isosphaeraceae bacterium]|jgi:lysophospholipase L1-like esterase|nr:GDSL-type esterase/lipase family protein [Isosphaeraceae bacterium]
MRNRIRRPRPVGILALAFVFLTGAGARGGEGRWVGTWAASPQRTEPANMPPAPGLADATLRQVVHVSLGGSRLRVRFSNAFGAKPLTILSASVATPTGGAAIRAESRKPLTFGGRPSVTIPRGAPMVSDPVDFDLAPLADLAVTVRVKDPTAAVTGHPGARCTSYLQGGDAATEPDLPTSARVPHWYYLCGVDVDAPDPGAAAVAVLGDSITDGRGSPTDGNGRWTDHLARRLHDDERTARVGVLNQGLGGNRLLNDGLGPNALARLDRDVLAQPVVRWLIVLEGINDLGTRSATARDVIGSYEQIVLRAHARGIKVYGATILPCEGSFYFGAGLEAARQEVNAWVRAPGHFDAVIDFDAATRDPRKPSRLAAAADGGDHLHPGPEGYKTMAGVVDLDLFGK